MSTFEPEFDHVDAAGGDPFPEIAPEQDFYDALHAGTLDPRAKVIADAITGAQDDRDRIGGLYANAYRGALAGLKVAPPDRPQT